MSLRGDDRAVTVQIGTVLLFGILIVSMSIYQSTAVPDQNEGVEYDHNQRVQSDMLELRNALLRTGLTGAGRPTSVQLGTRYPTRMVFRNPPASTGTLRTGPERTLTVANATAQSVETADYWNGSVLTFPTRNLVYEPRYNQYDAPATVYEHGLVYNRFRNGANITLSEQPMIDGRRITLVTIAGNLSRTQTDALSVDPRSLSPATTVRTVVLRNETGPITLTLPTRLPAATWNETISGGNVRDVRQNGSDAVDVVLEPNVEYELRMARIDVAGDAAVSGAHYITNVSHESEGGRRELVAEVRDRYDNPVSGVTVNATVTAGEGIVTPSNATTDASGRVRFTYNGSAAAGTQTVRLAIGDGSHERQFVTYDVGERIDRGDGAFAVHWLDPSGQQGTSYCSDEKCELNTNSQSTLELTMDTTPTADQAAVSFAVENTSIATLSSNTGTTGSNGESSVTLNGVAEGTTNVYTWSGGSGDTIEMTIRNFAHLRWETAAHWDAASTESGVVHETHTQTDWPGAGTIKLGYPSTDRNGANLVSYWPLDEDDSGPGNTVYDVAGTSDGTRQGSVGRSANGMFGATSYNFGSGSYVDVGTFDVSGDAMTISVWFYATNFRNTDARLISKATSDANQDHWWMLSERNNKLRYRLKTGTDPNSGTTELLAGPDGSITTKNWTHAVATYDGSEMRIYKDGALVASENKTGSIATDGSVHVDIGRNPDGTNPWDGRIDEMRIYNRSLTPSQVGALYDASTRGTLTTDWHSRNSGPVTDLHLTDVISTVSGSTNVTVYVESDVDDDGTVDETSDPISLDGNGGPYDVTGLTTDSGTFRLRVVLETTDPTTSPTFGGATIS